MSVTLRNTLRPTTGRYHESGRGGAFGRMCGLAMLLAAVALPCYAPQAIAQPSASLAELCSNPKLNCSNLQPGIPKAGVSATMLTPFERGPNYPTGSLVEDSDGNFYGTTSSGGSVNGGTIYRIMPSGLFNTLHSFVGSDGLYPTGNLVQGNDGNFYGTATGGGISSSGTVFRITPSGELTVLHSFANFDSPAAGLVKDSDGNFYGTTSFTVFRITPSGELTVLHVFSGDEGEFPAAALVQGNDGNFYGTTRQGGPPNSGGTVFRITPSGEFTLLHAFVFFADGGTSPSTALVQGRDGNFYGTTGDGGANGGGTLYRITPSGEFTVLYAFPSTDVPQNDGTTLLAQAGPSGLVQGSDGNFYATTKRNAGAGYAPDGNVYRITPSGELTVLHDFSGDDGLFPQAALVQASDGNFYGTTTSGGASGGGTLYRITPSGEFTVLYAFSVGDGSLPVAPVVRGNDGSFYGTSLQGGAADYGTVYRITPSGTLTVLHSFAGTDGSKPVATLTQGNDGLFYGTTLIGGEKVSGDTVAGTVYRITTSGEFSLLHSFSQDDGAGPTTLVQGDDGNFYGTTFGGGGISDGFGGVSYYGTVFGITTSGALTMLHSFAGSDGSEPVAALVQGSDSNFYGTTQYGGAAYGGTVYRITPSGMLIVLHSFSGSDGHFPDTALVQGSDDNFYGTTRAGGSSDSGTVYRITPSGEVSLLHSFSGDDGKSPTALIRSEDGNFYGTTLIGGELGFGTLFRITAAGEFSVLYNFGGEDGAFPTGVLGLGNGEFLVTASAFGPKGGGAIVRITQTATPVTPPADGDRGGGGGGSLTVAWLATLALLLFWRHARGRAPWWLPVRPR